MRQLLLLALESFASLNRWSVSAADVSDAASAPAIERRKGFEGEEEGRRGERPTVEWPGARTNGFVQLPNQWLLHPSGKQVVVGDFPVNIAVHPNGKFAAVLHGGNGENEGGVLDTTKATIVSRAEIEKAFYGLEFSPDGKTLACSGAGSET